MCKIVVSTCLVCVWCVHVNGDAGVYLISHITRRHVDQGPCNSDYTILGIYGVLCKKIAQDC